MGSDLSGLIGCWVSGVGEKSVYTYGIENGLGFMLVFLDVVGYRGLSTWRGLLVIWCDRRVMGWIWALNERRATRVDGSGRSVYMGGNERIMIFVQPPSRGVLERPHPVECICTSGPLVLAMAMGVF